MKIEKYKANAFIAEIEERNMVNYDMNYIIVFPEGAKNGEQIAKDYSKKLDQLHPYYLSDKSYISLTYPPESESDFVFDMFFESINRGLCRNKFVGTFMISLSQYKTFRDINKGRHFRKLEELIKNNVLNAAFFIHVFPEFELDELFDWLCGIKTTVVLEDFFPNYDDVKNYIFYELSRKGVELDSNEKATVEELIKKMMQEDAYKGYKTANDVVSKVVLVKKLHKECINLDDLMTDVLGRKKRQNERRIGF